MGKHLDTTLELNGFINRDVSSLCLGYVLPDNRSFGEILEEKGYKEGTSVRVTVSDKNDLAEASISAHVVKQSNGLNLYYNLEELGFLHIFQVLYGHESVPIKIKIASNSKT